jgi:hypothetical protein
MSHCGDFLRDGDADVPCPEWTYPKPVRRKFGSCGCLTKEFPNGSFIVSCWLRPKAVVRIGFQDTGEC